VNRGAPLGGGEIIKLERETYNTTHTYQRCDDAALSIPRSRLHTSRRRSSAPARQHPLTGLKSDRILPVHILYTGLRTISCYIIARTVLPRVLIFHQLSRCRRRRGVSAAALYKTDPGTTAPFSPLPRILAANTPTCVRYTAWRGGCGLTAPDDVRGRQSGTNAAAR